MPQISCVMPCYNSEQYVAEAIESILNQTFGDFEFIIIDDCSTDNSVNIIEEYEKKDRRIILLQNEENKGVAYSLNRGLAVAKGKYIARMDSDDISEPERFEKEFEYMENNEDIGVLGSNYFYFQGEDTNRGFNTHSETEDRDLKLKLLYTCPLAHPSIMIRKSVMDTNNIRYNEEYAISQDFELWREMTKITKFHNLPDALLRYRWHEKNNSKPSFRNTMFTFKIFNNIVKDIVAEEIYIPIYEKPEDTTELALRESCRVLSEIPLMRLKEDFPFTRAELGMAMYKQKETVFNKLGIS